MRNALHTASRRRRTARVATAGGGVNTAVGGRPRPRRRTAVAGAAPTPTSRKRRVGYQDRCNRRPQPPPQRNGGARVGPWYRLVLVYKIPRFRWTARPLLFTRRACFLLPAKRARARFYGRQFRFFVHVIRQRARWPRRLTISRDYVYYV